MVHTKLRFAFKSFLFFFVCFYFVIRYVCTLFSVFFIISCFFIFFFFSIFFNEMMNFLESEEQQERHHQTEKTHGFGQSESQNGVREKLLFEWWISGIADDERSKNCSNTSTCFVVVVVVVLVFCWMKLKSICICINRWGWNSHARSVEYAKIKMNLFLEFDAIRNYKKMKCIDT